MKDDTRKLEWSAPVVTELEWNDDWARLYLVTAALELAERFYIFPAKFRDGQKFSYRSQADNGKNWGATNDPEEIKRIYAACPNAGIGIPTGANADGVDNGIDNGIFVVEADTPEGHDVDGVASLRALEAEHGGLPVTLMAESPTGSLHHYFNHPRNGIKITSSSHKLALGVDVKGDGGMVIAPPTLRPGVGTYKWLNEGMPIADAPDWLIELITRDSISGEQRMPGEPEASIQEVVNALSVIPNDDLIREDWNNIGMATWRSTAGSAAGLAEFLKFSKKSKKHHNESTVIERWAHYFKSPPTKIGFGTLAYMAQEADPGWRHADIPFEDDDAHQADPGAGARNNAADTMVLVCAADVVIRAKDWLWEGHLLRSGLELMTGTPGLGKSQAQCSLIACVTNPKLTWPNGAKGLTTPISVIMVTAEDAIDQEVVPRLIAANADLKRVHILKCIKTDDRQRQFLIAEDLDKIKKSMAKIGDVGLITMDPITAYMGGKMDSHKTTEVRSQLGPLKDFAEEVNAAVSAITHPAKNPGKRAIDHFIASQAFIAAARIGHACFEEMEVDSESGESKPTGRVCSPTRRTIRASRCRRWRSGSSATSPLVKTRTAKESPHRA